VIADGHFPQLQSFHLDAYQVIRANWWQFIDGCAKNEKMQMSERIINFFIHSLRGYISSSYSFFTGRVVRLRLSFLPLSCSGMVQQMTEFVEFKAPGEMEEGAEESEFSLLGWGFGSRVG